MRIAVFTLEALAAAEAVSRFIAAEAGRIVLVGLSDPYRPAMGGMVGQTWRHIRRSGLGFLPYLATNFTLPEIAGAFGRGPELPGRVARRMAIPVQLVAEVNGPALHAALRQLAVDLIVSFHFDQIFNAETLAIPRLGGINVHPSLLPVHRGPVPTLHALLAPVPQFGVSVHRLAVRIDAGGILAQTAVALPAGRSVIGAAAALHLAALPLLPGVLEAIAAGREQPMFPDQRPYCGFPSRAELAGLRARGAAAANWADLRAAFARRA